jgi:hypothetical protein
LGRRRHYYGWRQWQNPAGGASLDNSLMERALSQLRMNGKLKPGSYVAFAPAEPDLETGAPKAREEASFHVIMGEW